ncbi:MAG: hypothetical protein NVS4B5_15900 [Vulcanimicrobiaceae bacterium]
MTMTTTTGAPSERRIEAPHPGPQIHRDYIEALGISIAEMSAHVGIELPVLEAMFAGTRSIDVDAAIRIARALQLPAERIMRMQVRSDFADARGHAAARGIDVFVPQAAPPFPTTFRCGRLARTNGSTGDGSFFFQESPDTAASGGTYAGLHALWRGDRLRVYDDAGEPEWSGPVATDFDGRVLLPYVRTEVWLSWFAAARRADLHFGPEHVACFERSH